MVGWEAKKKDGRSKKGKRAGQKKGRKVKEQGEG